MGTLIFCVDYDLKSVTELVIPVILLVKQSLMMVWWHWGWCFVPAFEWVEVVVVLVVAHTSEVLWIVILIVGMMIVAFGVAVVMNIAFGVVVVAVVLVVVCFVCIVVVVCIVVCIVVVVVMMMVVVVGMMIVASLRVVMLVFVMALLLLAVVVVVVWIEVVVALIAFEIRKRLVALNDGLYDVVVVLVLVHQQLI